MKPSLSCHCPWCSGSRLPEQPATVAPTDQPRDDVRTDPGMLKPEDIGRAAIIPPANKPLLGSADIIRQLRTQWSGIFDGTVWQWQQAGDIIYSIPDAPLQNGGYEVAGFLRMAESRKQLIRRCFELWDDLIAKNLTERDQVDHQQIQFAFSTRTLDDGTYSSPSLVPGGINPYAPRAGSYALTRAEVWLNAYWPTHDRDSDFYFGSYAITTAIHEIGHALGLSHPGTYNANDGSIITYATAAEFAQDTQAYSLMSYFLANADGSGSDHWGRDLAWRYPQTPMLYDIAAIQAMYGADFGTRAGDTVYGFNATAGNNVYDFVANPEPVLAIWDGGGIDTLDASGYPQNQRIALEAGSFSDIGAMTRNVAIAFGADIEHAIGGRGSDILSGNALGNRLDGGSGDDLLSGLGGSDTLIGGAGSQDMVILRGAPAQYQIMYHPGMQAFSIVDSVAGRDGTDQAIGIEYFYFFQTLQTIAASRYAHIDLSAPVLLRTTPADGSSLVHRDTDLSLTFSEPVTRGAGLIQLRTATGQLVESFDIQTSDRVRHTGAELNIDPSADLAPGTMYFLSLPQGVVIDLAGNAYAGSSDYDFTTAGAGNSFITSVLDPADVSGQYGLYRLSSGAYALAGAGLRPGDIPSQVSLLVTESSGKGWSPKGNPVAIDLQRDPASGALTLTVLSQAGTGSKTSYTEQNFVITADGSRATPSGKSQNLAIGQLLGREADWQQDINGDGVIGDAIASVIDSADISNTYGLYQLASGSYALAAAGLPISSVPLRTIPLHADAKGKPWTAKGAPIALQRQPDPETGSDRLLIISQSGTGSKAQFAAHDFILDDRDGRALSSGKIHTLLLPQLLEKEAQLGQDLNGDSVIGDAIAAIFDDADPSLSYGLYQLASGRLVIAAASLGTGTVPDQAIPLLADAKGKPWALKGSPLAIMVQTDDTNASQSLSLLSVTIKGSKRQYTEDNFIIPTPANAAVSTGKPLRLSNADIALREARYAEDFDPTYQTANIELLGLPSDALRVI